MTRLRWPLALLVSVVLAAPKLAQSWDPERNAHIEAHVPDAARFSALLQRDLLAHFQASGLSAARRVDATLLRDGPTQSGLSYPKFYAWVRVFGGEDELPLQQVAVRLAAIERERFEVTRFVPASQIRAEGDAAIECVFPQALHTPMRALVAKAP